MSLNVIIVDDEPLALDVLETYIARTPELRLLKRCENAFEANDALRQYEIDLMFLDIQMPQMSGVDFLKTLTKPPMVIFTTAFSTYAVESFELNVLDFLLKPIPVDRFMKAVNKAIEHKAKESHIGEAESDAEYIFVKSDKKLVRVKFSEILYVEGLKDYVIIRTETGRVISLQTMKSLEDKLGLAKFVRIHRSYIVAMDKIQAIVGNMVEVMEKGLPKHLPIGKNYRDELLELIDKHKL